MLIQKIFIRCVSLCSYPKENHINLYIVITEISEMVEAKKNERANALKEVKRLCKEFGFTAGVL